MNRQANNPIACRLDKILVNDNWYDLFPNSDARAEKMMLSDHSPILVSIGKETTFVNRSFKHFNKVKISLSN